MTAYLKLIHRVAFEPFERDLRILKKFIVHNELNDEDIAKIEHLKNELELLFETVRKDKK